MARRWPLELLEVHADAGGGGRGHVGGRSSSAMALAVMPNLPSSMARVLVKPCMPALAAIVGLGQWLPRAEVLDRLTMRAPAGVDHVLLAGLAHVEGATQVDGHDRVPVADGHLEQHVVVDDAGVVDQDGGGAQFGDDLVDGRGHRIGVGDVGAHGDGLAVPRR